MSTTTGIPLAEAEIVGIVLESVFYGLFRSVRIASILFRSHELSSTRVKAYFSPCFPSACTCTAVISLDQEHDIPLWTASY